MHQYEEIQDEAVLGFCTHVHYMAQNYSSLLPLVSCFAKRSTTRTTGSCPQKMIKPPCALCLAHTDCSPSTLGIPRCGGSRGCSGVQMAEGNTKQPLGTEFQYAAFEKVPGENQIFFHAEA